MEIVIRPRLLALAATLAVAAVAALLILHPTKAELQAALGRLGAAASPAHSTATPLPIAAPGTTQLSFESQTSAWTWKTICDRPLASYLHAYPLQKLHVVLVDPPATPSRSTVGVAYPAPKGEHAQADAACDGTLQELTCQVHVQSGKTGDDLDVAVTTVVPYAVQQFYTLKTPGSLDALDALRRSWSWERFEPLIRKEGNSWRSACLAVSSRP